MPGPVHIMVMTAVNSRDEAGKLAKLLVKERAAACVTVLSACESTYWWQGAITTDQEWLLLIKTRAEIYATVEKIISDNHSYSVPEILALPIMAGSGPYLKWLDENTKKE